MRGVAAYVLALVLVWFGAGKLLHLQFMIAPHVLDTPVGALEPRELMWTFFGFSRTYEWLIGAVELGGAFLVMLPATRLAGALLLLPVLLNILVLDVLFGVHAVQIASLLVALALFLVLSELRRLAPLVSRRVSRLQLALNVGLVLAVVATTVPTLRERDASLHELSGGWHTVGASGALGIDALYFEAFGECVARTGERLERFECAVDPERHSVSLFGAEARYRLDAGALVIEGTHDAQPFELTLRKKTDRGGPL
jgi:hypothetical protein